jgi:hypothetical protein
MRVTTATLTSLTDGFGERSLLFGFAKHYMEASAQHYIVEERIVTVRPDPGVAPECRRSS